MDTNGEAVLPSMLLLTKELLSLTVIDGPLVIF